MAGAYPEQGAVLGTLLVSLVAVSETVGPARRAGGRHDHGMSDHCTQ